MCTYLCEDTFLQENAPGISMVFNIIIVYIYIMLRYVYSYHRWLGNAVDRQNKVMSNWVSYELKTH